MQPSGLRTNLGAEFAAETKAASYPYVLITSFGSELPLLLEDLTPGELPIVVRHDQKLLAVGSVSKSAIELNKLRRVYRYEIVLSETERHAITSTENIMEVLPWMVP